MFRLSKITALLMILMAIMPTSAQTNCGGLSRDDCTLLKNAQSATSNLSSAGFKMTIDFDFGISFLPELISFRMVADGTYTRVPVTRDDVDGEYRPLYGLNADMTIYIDGEISDIIQPRNNSLTTSLDLRYVDGIGYANLNKILSISRAQMWYSVDVAEYLRRLIRDRIFPDNALTVLSEFFVTDIWNTFALDGDVTRLGDMVLDAQTFAVFEINLSYDDYFNDHPYTFNLFVNMLEQALRTTYGMTYSDSELRQAAEGYAQFFRDMNMRFRQMVGMDDSYVHVTQFEYTFIPTNTTPISPDPINLGLLSGSGFELRFLLDFRYTQFDNVPLITAPEESQPVRYEDLFGNGANSLF